MSLFKQLSTMFTSMLRERSLVGDTVENVSTFRIGNNFSATRGQITVVYELSFCKCVSTSIFSAILSDVSSMSEYDIRFITDSKFIDVDVRSPRFTGPRTSAYNRFVFIGDQVDSLKESGKNSDVGEQVRISASRKFNLNNDSKTQAMADYMDFIHIEKESVKGNPFLEVSFFLEQTIYDRYLPEHTKIKDYRENCRDSLVRLLSGYCIDASVQGHLADYYESKSILSLDDATHYNNGIQIMSTLDLARLHTTKLSSYTRNDFPIDFGTNAMNGEMVSADIINSVRGNIFAITGPTGTGKTFELHSMIPSILKEGAHIEILDIQGDASIPIVKALKEVEQGMGNVKKTFRYAAIDFTDPFLRLNPLRLDTVSEVVYSEIDRLDLSQQVAYELELDLANSLYEMAVECTYSICCLLVNGVTMDGGLSAGNLSEIKEIVRKTFSFVGVRNDDLSSFKNTRNLTFDDVVSRAKSFMETSGDSAKEKYRYIHDKMFNSLSVTSMLSKQGDTYNPITIRDILDSHVVIYMFWKNKSEDFTTDDYIKLEVMKILDSQKFHIRKMLGLYTVLVFEDVQRYLKYNIGGKNPILDYAFHKTSGSRMTNVITFLLYNYARMEEEVFQSILANITGVLTFHVPKEDIPKFVRNYKLPKEYEDLLYILDKQQGTVEGADRVFALSCKTQEGRKNELVMARMTSEFKVLYEKHKSPNERRKEGV